MAHRCNQCNLDARKGRLSPNEGVKALPREGLAERHILKLRARGYKS
jgi:hypothetical protein